MNNALKTLKALPFEKFSSTPSLITEWILSRYA